MSDNPFCLVLRPPSRECGELALDALEKAAGMLRAWAKGPRRPEKGLGVALSRIETAKEGEIVRTDCPAFAGYHDARGVSIPLCRANGCHPDYFRLGGIFHQYGVTTCGRCSWHQRFAPGEGHIK